MPELRGLSVTERYCDGLSRRDFVQVGLGGMFASGLAGLLRGRSAALAEGRADVPAARAVNCILLWMDGGPSHYESFDPKPDAPAEIRGELGPIETSVPGIRICEAMPHVAKIVHKAAIIRSITHKDQNHGGGNHYLCTGTPTPVPVACGASASFHPSYGAVVSHERGFRDGIPPYVALPHLTRSGGPSFLGARNAPFVVPGDPNRPDFSVRDIVLPEHVSDGRALRRGALRRSLDRLLRIRDAAAEDPTVSFDTYYDQALDLISSREARAAFDIGTESDETRDLYGRTDVGQRMLFCRRLVEAGVSFVTYQFGGWDHHTKIFPAFTERHMPKFDRALAALVNDLDARGLLDSTLVLALGEFGRTPVINKDAGRDHWPGAMSVFAAGAGIPGGQVIGATDVKGYYAADDILSPEDLAASIYTKMGIDPHQVFHTKSGRPVALVNGGKPIARLFG